MTTDSTSNIFTVNEATVLTYRDEQHPPFAIGYAGVKKAAAVRAVAIMEYGHSKNAMAKEILIAVGLTADERASIDANRVPALDDVPRGRARHEDSHPGPIAA